MAQPVWTLSVDLQTKTATFTSGLADAAKGARGSFDEIKSGAQEMGGSVNYSMTEARHGVMLLGEEFGIHIPRALTSFIASLGPIGEAMEAAFPFLAIAVGATLLLEHLAKLRAEGEKLTESQVTFGTTVANVLNGLDEKLIEAGIRTDELNHNHLAALNKELQLIDRQSMNELVKSFDVVAKAADATFAELKTSWYSFDAGSAGAKASLESFKVQYESLLSQGKDPEALALLDAKIAREQTILNLEKQYHEAQARPDEGHKGDPIAFAQAKQGLQKLGVEYAEKETAAQQLLVQALQAQAQVTEKVNALKKAEKTEDVKKADVAEDKDAEEALRKAHMDLESREKVEEEFGRRRLEQKRKQLEESERLGEDEVHANEAVTKALKDAAKDREKLEAEAGKDAAEHSQRMGMLAVAAEQEQSKLINSARRTTDQERMAEALKAEADAFKVKLDANNREIEALDKNGKDYENKLKQLQGRQIELIKAHENEVTQITNKATEERNAREIAAQQHMNDAIAHSLTQLAMRHESFAKMVSQLGDQMISGMMETAIKSVLANDFTKESDAAAAARKAYNSMASIPYIGPALGAAAAAAAFTSLMAFEGGGIVPGVGNGDTVPAMLTPGEAVLPKNLTEGLTHAAQNGTLDGGGGADIHIHHSPTYHVQAIDRSGVREMLNNHTAEFTNHFHNELRKMNK